MAIRPSTPEIITVNSEALQEQIRDLLPSQNGFGSELQASNVITPIIDLTSTAEGSGLPDYLQTALAFGSQTAFSQVGSGTTVIANSPGFYRIYANASVDCASATARTASLEMTDGLSTKTIWELGNISSNSVATVLEATIDLVVFLAAGESISAVCNTNNLTAIVGSVRQIATGDGTLVQPSGFPL